mmetsp:Transcript_10040/g.24253  ORF Transcript_10040/g.24253 Transcript_10040/m.24253 type:complete len:226 (+) Transcript_10040:326-1003(+)
MAQCHCRMAPSHFVSVLYPLQKHLHHFAVTSRCQLSQGLRGQLPHFGILISQRGAGCLDRSGVAGCCNLWQGFHCKPPGCCLPVLHQVEHAGHKVFVTCTSNLHQAFDGSGFCEEITAGHVVTEKANDLLVAIFGNAGQRLDGHSPNLTAAILKALAYCLDCCLGARLCSPSKCVEGSLPHFATRIPHALVNELVGNDHGDLKGSLALAVVLHALAAAHDLSTTK